MNDIELVTKAAARIAWIWILWPMAIFGFLAALYMWGKLIYDEMTKRRQR